MNEQKIKNLKTIKIVNIGEITRSRPQGWNNDIITINCEVEFEGKKASRVLTCYGDRTFQDVKSGNEISVDVQEKTNRNGEKYTVYAVQSSGGKKGDWKPKPKYSFDVLSVFANKCFALAAGMARTEWTEHPKVNEEMIYKYFDTILRTFSVSCDMGVTKEVEKQLDEKVQQANDKLNNAGFKTENMTPEIDMDDIPF